MGTTYQDLNILLSSDLTPIDVDELGKLIVTEIFFRTSMMFRLAENGYSRAYLIELDTIIEKLVQLHNHLASKEIPEPDIRTYVEGLFSQSLVSALKILNPKDNNSDSNIKEVLSNLIDLSQNTDYKLMLRTALLKANTGDITGKINRIGSIAALSIVGSMPIMALIHTFGFIPDLTLTQMTTNVSLVIVANLTVFKLLRMASRKGDPLKFKSIHKYIFDGIKDTCSLLLSPSTIGDSPNDVNGDR